MGAVERAGTELARRTSRRRVVPRHARADGRRGNRRRLDGGGRARTRPRGGPSHLRAPLHDRLLPPPILAAVEDGRYGFPVHPRLGYPVDDEGAIYLSERQTRRKVCRTVVPERFPFVRNPRYGGGWSRCCNGRAFGISRTAVRSPTRGSTATVQCRPTPATRKVFCITYRELNVRLLSEAVDSALVAASVVAGISSLFGPWGLSMVETITPVVHGGSREPMRMSLALHAVGAAVAAAIVGSLLAGSGRAARRAVGVPDVVLVAVAAALYVARELGAPVPVPQLRRQVPTGGARSSPRMRRSLYGLGLGPGFLTYLGHGTVVVVSVAAFASGRPLLGAAVLAPFGLARGLGPVFAFGVRSPSDRAALVERLDRSASKARWQVANTLALSMMLVAAVVEVLGIDGPSEVGALAAAGVALTFGAAAVAKLARRAVWWRTLGSYGLRPAATGLAGFGVPAAELGIAALVFAGLGRRRDSCRSSRW